MHSPSAIKLLVDPQIVRHRPLLRHAEEGVVRARYVPHHHQPWQKEVGSAIVAGPVAVLRL